MRYLVSCTWLRFLDDEEQEVFEVETGEASDDSEEEARRAAEPQIAEYAATLGRPTFIRVESAQAGLPGEDNPGRPLKDDPGKGSRGDR